MRRALPILAALATVIGLQVPVVTTELGLASPASANANHGKPAEVASYGKAVELA